MNALLLDAYDSFIYILHQYLIGLEVTSEVVRNDKISLDQIADKNPDFILLGPGPGHPQEAGYQEIIHRFKGQIPILGVCLGHQAIGMAFGADIARASHLKHGKTSIITHDGKGCFAAYDAPFSATRYHSLIVTKDSVPPCLQITATADDDDYIMGLRHTEYLIESIQFHPESICTEQGLQIISSFIKTYVGEI